MSSLVSVVFLSGYRGRTAPLLLADETLVYVWDDPAAGDGRLDQRVQLLISTDSKLKNGVLSTERSLSELRVIWTNVNRIDYDFHLTYKPSLTLLCIPINP